MQVCLHRLVELILLDGSTGGYSGARLPEQSRHFDAAVRLLAPEVQQPASGRHTGARLHIPVRIALLDRAALQYDRLQEIHPKSGPPLTTHMLIFSQSPGSKPHERPLADRCVADGDGIPRALQPPGHLCCGGRNTSSVPAGCPPSRWDSCIRRSCLSTRLGCCPAAT